MIEFLGALRRSKREKDRIRLADLEERLEQYAIYGYLEPKVQLRHIEDDIWEIKSPNDRILLYHAAANEVHKRAARMTHAFEKRLNKTPNGKLPRGQILKAMAIQREDEKRG
ncbi:hypothetical protein [Agromyces albus]|uniref:hypothetical protein n=1 Tax=Agromyces albus TaxID=205332 RepID=UPI002780222D|nr:hypothetical protein [Agromyces albus]MDQ0574301.1 phage-related protein [Agromyces albus]